MKCCRLIDGEALPGLPADRYPVENAPVQGGLVHQASVALVLPGGADVDLFSREAKQQQGRPVWQFGHAWLRAPAATESADLLVALDLTQYWPDSNLGDTSTLLWWTGTEALYRCPSMNTFIRDRADGHIFINLEGEPSLMDATAYEGLRDSYEKLRVVQRVRQAPALLDNLVT